MKLKDRCIAFGKASLEKLNSDGESRETALWLYEKGGQITDRLADKTLKSSEWAGGVLDVKTACIVRLLSLSTKAERDGLIQPRR